MLLVPKGLGFFAARAPTNPESLTISPYPSSPYPLFRTNKMRNQNGCKPSNDSGEFWDILGSQSKRGRHLDGPFRLAFSAHLPTP